MLAHTCLSFSQVLQDKENRQTPSTAYVSSRLGLTSPALQTPSHAGTADLEDPTASNAKPSCDNAHAASTLAKGSISGYTLPFTHDEAHGTPSSAVASVPPCTGVAGAPAAAAPAAETALPAGVFGDRRLSSPEGPTHSIAQEGGSNPYDLAKEQQATAPQTRVSPACTALTWLCSQEVVAVCTTSTCTHSFYCLPHLSHNRPVWCVGMQS